MPRSFDAIVVGAGIVGLSHAWAIAQTGRSVCVVERDAAQIGASIRNFGFVTVTGQRAGSLWRIARRSRELWIIAAQAAAIPVLQTGLHVVARRPEAAAVLEAFRRTPMGEGCQILSRRDFLHRTSHPALGECEAVLVSPHELRVEPREATPKLLNWLQRAHGVEVLTSCAVVGIETGRAHTTRGVLTAETIFACPGADLFSLFPERMAQRQVTQCKLQMLRTAAPGWRLPSPLMSDLGLARYPGYADLPEASALRAVLEREQPAHLENGVHLIAVQSADGSLVVGDSHHYGPSPDPFSDEGVDQLILDEWRATTGKPAPPVTSRWIGTYASSAQQDWFCDPVAPGVYLCVVTCGAGMSTAFAIGESNIAAVYGAQSGDDR